MTLKILKIILLGAFIFLHDSRGETDIQKQIAAKTKDQYVIEILYGDYEIIEYTETALLHKSEKTQMGLMIKLISNEKIKILKNAANPIITIEFNNQKHVAKGNHALSSSVPPDSDFFFAIDGNGKILFLENNIIGFIGFKNK